MHMWYGLLMRTSPLKHPLAVLRVFLGLGQKELANMLDCSVSAIQRIELCAMPLSEKLASRIQYETGVSLQWLLDGDPKADIVDSFGRPYMKQIYEWLRAYRTKLPESMPDLYKGNIRATIGRLLFEVEEIALSAYNRGEFDLMAYKMREAHREVQKQFGPSGSVNFQVPGYRKKKANLEKEGILKLYLVEIEERIEEALTDKSKPRTKPLLRRRSRSSKA